MNKYPIDTAILGCSYNITGTKEENNARVKKQVHNEKAARNPYQNHLILRSSDNPNIVKFHFPLHRIPLFLYALFDLYKAGFKQVVVVGNNDTKRIYEKFCNYFNINHFTFVHEGSHEKLSLSNTIRKGKSHLNLSDKELTLFLPGDTPFVSTKALAYDIDTLTNDIVLQVNTKEITGHYFYRNYHVAFVDKRGNRYLFKEPNPWIMNLVKFEKEAGLNILDVGYGLRKFYSREAKLSKTLENLLIREERKISLNKVLEINSILGYKERYQIICMGINKGIRLLSKWLGPPIKIPKKKKKIFTVGDKVFEKLVKYKFNLKVRIKPSIQAGALMDLDSWEDLAYGEEALRIGVAEVYPHYKELKEFCDGAGKWDIDYIDNWQDYANKMFESYGIKALYKSNGTLEQKIFDPGDITKQIELIQASRKASSLDRINCFKWACCNIFY